MENDMRSGLGAPSEAELSEAIDQICLAEGVTRDKLMSVKIIDGEISVRHVRSNGFGRTSTYPIAALLPRLIGANHLSQVITDDSDTVSPFTSFRSTSISRLLRLGVTADKRPVPNPVSPPPARPA
jgi:hypothetical protein